MLATGMLMADKVNIRKAGMATAVRDWSRFDDLMLQFFLLCILFLGVTLQVSLNLVNGEIPGIIVLGKGGPLAMVNVAGIKDFSFGGGGSKQSLFCFFGAPLLQ